MSTDMPVPNKERMRTDMPLPNTDPETIFFFFLFFLHFLCIFFFFPLTFWNKGKGNGSCRNKFILSGGVAETFLSN